MTIAITLPPSWPSRSEVEGSIIDTEPLVICATRSSWLVCVLAPSSVVTTEMPTEAPTLRNRLSRLAPSVRHVGSAFADWLEAQPDAPPGLHELARFEWLQAAAFDAIDASTLGIDDIAALAPESWPTLRLRLHPCVQRLESVRLAVVEGVPTPADVDSPVRWLLWRDAGGDVQWRQLEDDEAEALHAVSNGASFGELCERLAASHGGDGPLRAASLLKRWLADGLLAADAAISD